MSEKLQGIPRLVIVGRPNVGKSTLFNRLLGRRRALVHDLPGVTRDRLEEEAEWWVRGLRFPIRLVDTGGIGGDKFAQEIETQVGIALETASVVLLLLDGRAGLNPADEEILRRMKQAGVEKKAPILGIVNKVDAEVHEDRIADFYAIGLDPLLTVSAEHGRGMDDLKEAVVDALQGRGLLRTEIAISGAEEDGSQDEPGPGQAPENGELEEELEEDEFQDEDEEAEESPESYERRVPRIAIVGRPNVGKSTLINALLRENRMITSPIAGTTVDAVDSEVMLGGKPYVFIDTAGIRRKNKTEQGVEVLSVVQARKALERCDVAVLLLDGESGITDQDEKIGGLIEEAGCGVVLAVNKWDTQRNNPKFTRDAAAEIIREEMGYLKYAPILFMSALRGRGFEQIGELVDEILEQRKVKVPTREFSEWVRARSEIHNPMNARFYMSHQSGRNPPTFVCHVSDPEKVHFSLKRHLLNAIRERWGYMGNPVRIHFVKGKSTRAALTPNQRQQRRASQR